MEEFDQRALLMEEAIPPDQQAALDGMWTTVGATPHRDGGTSSERGCEGTSPPLPSPSTLR